tara:strand:+ start:11452 stop:12894 length:1443 start_codon:yes stop_codon:yes gene_type:complete
MSKLYSFIPYNIDSDKPSSNIKSSIDNKNNNQNNNKNDGNDNGSKKNNKLTPILDAEELLQDPILQEILKDIKQLSNTPEKAFDKLYLPVINNYVEFVQSLPNLRHPQFKVSKGQLVLGLIRSLYALEKLDDYPIPLNLDNINDNDPNHTIEKFAAKWHYAVFTAGLLCGVGFIVKNPTVQLCNEKSDILEQWDALVNSMLHTNENATHYFYEEQKDENKLLGRKLTLLIANKLIPAHNYNWLLSEPDIFVEWSAMLEHEEAGSGTLYSIIKKASRELQQDFLGSSLPTQLLELNLPMQIHLQKKQEYSENSFWKGVEYSLRKHRDNHLERSSKNAKLFITWLKSELKSKNVSYNKKDSLVHISKDGVFLLHPNIFLKFKSAYKANTADAITLFKDFNYMGFSKLSGQDYVFEKYFGYLNNPQIKRGVILKKDDLIFDKVPEPHPDDSNDPAITNHNRIYPKLKDEEVKPSFNPKNKKDH